MPGALGLPVLEARLREQPEDFFVDEDLGFEPEGEGEHLFLRVEKRGANTAFVAAELARWAGVAPVAVGYAGLKDRHALTRQTFSVQLPGRRAPDGWPEHPEYRVLSAARHRRKLPRGALAGNHFALRLRAVRGDREAIDHRLQQIATRGVPNAFGAQRFGRDGDNLERARALFAGRRMRREQASMLVSAARSAAFNAVLAARVRDGCWDEAVAGEVFMLAGNRSVFGPQPLDESLRERCRDGDISPTGPLWGRGELRSSGRSRGYDLGAAALGPWLVEGLEKAGLRQERRALRVVPRALAWEWLDQDVPDLILRFGLPPGSYATVLLAELGACVDAAHADADAAASEPEE